MRNKHNTNILCFLNIYKFSGQGSALSVGGRNHLANLLWRLAIELGVEVAVMESSDEGGDDFRFSDVENRISHLGKTFDIATEELGRFLVDTI